MVLTNIFNTSLELCYIPACFKASTIIPNPRKAKVMGLNNYRHIALTSVVMKVLECLILAHLKSITDPMLDPMQFAYRANRPTVDAVNMALHYMLEHLDTAVNYARILFVDFSSTFNSIHIMESIHNHSIVTWFPTTAVRDLGKLQRRVFQISPGRSTGNLQPGEAELRAVCGASAEQSGINYLHDNRMC